MRMIEHFTAMLAMMIYVAKVYDHVMMIRLAQLWRSLGWTELAWNSHTFRREEKRMGAFTRLMMSICMESRRFQFF